jgi:YggT family protein
MTFILAKTLDYIFTFLYAVIFIDVIASWIVMANAKLPDVVYRVLAVVHNIAGVVLNPIRRIIPNMGGLDISPIIALVLLQLLQQALHSMFRGF